MGTEYSNNTKPKIRSPLRLANSVHFALGVLAALLGILVLLGSRDSLADLGNAPSAMIGIATAVVLLMAGGYHVALSMAYWSFSFTQEDIGLIGANGTQKEQQARSASFEYLRSILTGGMTEAKPFPGAVGGALAALVPLLACAPYPVRVHAYVQMLKSMHLAVLLVGFVVAWMMTPPAMFPWIAAVFFFLAAAAIKPFDGFKLIREGRMEGQAQEPLLLPSLKKSILLLLFVVLSPVALSMLSAAELFPAARFPASLFAIPTLLLLVPSLIGSALYFFALTRQSRELVLTSTRYIGIDEPTSDVSVGVLDTAAAVVREKSNCLLRTHHLSGGLVQGEVMLETEPVQIECSSAATLREALSEAWSSHRLRPLFFLEMFGLALGIGSFLLLTAVGVGAGSLTTAIAAAGLLSASQSCLVSAHRLWRRADFRSRLYWMHYKSTISQVARDGGNAVRGNGKVSDVSTRAITGFIYCSVGEISSVSFAQGGMRYLAAFDFLPSESSHMMQVMQAHDVRIKILQDKFDQHDAERNALLAGRVSGKPQPTDTEGNLLEQKPES